jgi:hypothetical protein
MNPKELKITEIEFDVIKQNLKNYLLQQDEFSGYNFEGSALNILLDILAYNTYYQAFYNNMTVNEMFLDSANKRSSIVSIAKHFAYRPRTIKSSRSQVEITTTDITKQQYARGSRITATSGGDSYSFYLPTSVILTPSEYTSGSVSKLTTGTIEVVEGFLKKYSFTAGSSNSQQKFVIPFQDVDASTLRVFVQTNSTVNEQTEYTEATNITDLSATSTVYFLEENSDGYLQLSFGDGIIGKGLINGNIIRIEILQSSGADANGIGIVNSSSIFGGVTGDVNSSTRVVVPSSGGAAAETKESIRFNATRNYTTQNRAVTKEDYRSIILKDFPSIEDVICWGGEENTPPQYGKVFVSAKPRQGAYLSQQEKSTIISTITKTRNVVGVRLDFADPEVVYLNITVNLKVDPVGLVGGTQQLKSDVQDAIYDYTDNELNLFDKDFYATELSTIIQDVDRHIISNEILVSLEKRFVPTFDAVSHNYELNFNNAIFHPQDGYKAVLTSNLFGYLDSSNVDRDCELEDDGYGNIVLFYRQNANKVTINSKIGTINYTTGVIYLNKFKPSSLINNLPISLYCVPDEADIAAKQKMYLVHEQPSNISLVINTTEIPYRNR